MHGEALRRCYPQLQAIHAQLMPTARAELALARSVLLAGRGLPAQAALPLYIRDKVAQTTAEREAAKAKLAATPSGQT